MKIDLHLHSNASDGDYSPTSLVRQFKHCNYQAIALSDHDTVKGIPEFLRAGKRYNLLTLPGVEMSSIHKGVNIHIIGLGINHRHQGLCYRFQRYQKARIKRAQTIVKKLKKLGFTITYKDVKKMAKGVVNRPHIAKALLSHPENKPRLKKYVTKKLTISHIIQELIYDGKPAYARYKKMTAKNDIKLIHQAGGIAILCHPWFLREVTPRINQENFIASLKQAGIDGIEAFPMPRNNKLTKRYSRLARKYNLLISAGSDFQGPVHNQKIGNPNIQTFFL